MRSRVSEALRSGNYDPEKILAPLCAEHKVRGAALSSVCRSLGRFFNPRRGGVTEETRQAQQTTATALFWHADTDTQQVLQELGLRKGTFGRVFARAQERAAQCKQAIRLRHESRAAEKNKKKKKKEKTRMDEEGGGGLAASSASSSSSSSGSSSSSSSSSSCSSSYSSSYPSPKKRGRSNDRPEPPSYFDPRKKRRDATDQDITAHIRQFYYTVSTQTRKGSSTWRMDMSLKDALRHWIALARLPVANGGLGKSATFRKGLTFFRQLKPSDVHTQERKRWADEPIIMVQGTRRDPRPTPSPKVVSQDSMV